MLTKTTWLVAGRAIGDGLAFVFYIVLARTFGGADVGDYAFAFSLAALFGLWVEFGFVPLLTRNVARDHASIHKYLGTVAVVQVALTALVGSALFMLIRIIGYSDQVSTLLALAFASLALGNIGRTFAAYLQAIEAMDKSALLEIAGKLTTALCGLALIFAGAPLPMVLFGHILGSAVYLVIAFYWVQRYFGVVEFRFSRNLAKTNLIAALPFVLGTGLYELYSRVDIIMLHHLVSEAETGQYATAARLVMAPLVFAYLISIAMYPTLSRTQGVNQGARDALFLGGLKWLAIFGATGAIILFSIGKPVVLLIFGQEFKIAANLIRWMAILFFIQSTTFAYSRLILTLNREYTALKIRGVTVGLNVLLNFLLIPIWGVYGAIWASIVSETLRIAISHLICAKAVPGRYLHRAGRLLLACAAAVATAAFVDGLVPWPALGTIALFMLGIVAIATRVIGEKDLAQLKTALRGLGAKSVNS